MCAETADYRGAEDESVVGVKGGSGGREGASSLFSAIWQFNAPPTQSFPPRILSFLLLYFRQP